jgi:formiminotetrahydrofolate cyclodeaminase
MMNNHDELINKIETLEKALAEAIKERDSWKKEYEDLDKYLDNFIDATNDILKYFLTEADEDDEEYIREFRKEWL